MSRSSPGGVLPEVMMPGMRGYEVSEAIRTNLAHAMLPVVFVTALDPAQAHITLAAKPVAVQS